ncbi:MAG: L-serine ammonia-lyase, iron-sulfur-dependent, subunit alpha [Negativicutes bacterium]|nr:L-serine ammonia-lyase, iron-sulfur-dependent, subunit alpha [Negativicutes bacterium]
MNDKLSLSEWLNAAAKQETSFVEFCIADQTERLRISRDELLARMLSMIVVMREAIQTGLTGRPSRGGLVGGDALKMERYYGERSETSLVGTTMRRAITFALAVGEANASMGRIVAAPTAGASGVLPGVLFALAEQRGLNDQQLAEGLLVAGAIGMVIASRATLSGAAGGCQAECGSAAAMAAGAAVSLAGGTPAQIGNAAAIALKNLLGLVCDPVAGLVEVPCVKRNAGAAAQALAAAEMALAGIRSVIPVDEVIDAMASVGGAMHCSLRETAQGGLAATPTGLAWTNKLFK